MMSLLYTRDLLSLCPSAILMTLILILRNSYADEAAYADEAQCHFVSTRIYTRKRFYKAVTCYLGS